MFKRLDEVVRYLGRRKVRVTIDGVDHSCGACDTVAITLLSAGFAACRETAVSGAPRGPFCLMGTCYDCLVTIDGRQNQQACAVVVREGMRIELQRGARELAP
ncbi:MAG: (2Fe-2S)-binding protein [Candidimonas sp.]|nr:MAG: (2Fe-2S)-binding protein [Candidimonas sp.]